MSNDEDLPSVIKWSADRQVIASNQNTEAIIDSQNARYKAQDNRMQQLDNTVNAGFSGVERQLGAMGSAMSMGFNFLNSSVLESTKAICNKLDTINKNLERPLFRDYRELYEEAFKSCIRGHYEDALEYLQRAFIKITNDPFAHYLLGRIYLYGISESSNVTDLSKSIEALTNAAKYITYYAKTDNEARKFASEIFYNLGLAYDNKAKKDDLHNSNKTDYEKHLNEAKTAYSKSYEYSPNMLESLYNLARCKALTNDKDGALQDLERVILFDDGYYKRTVEESDFDKEFKDKLFNQLKRELYPVLKVFYDRIKSVRTNFQSPYSYNLTQLIKAHLPNTFTEDTPLFDMLKARLFFPEILAILEREQKEYIEKCAEEERNRVEQERKDREDRIERERRAEQERIYEQQQRIKSEKWAAKYTRRRIMRIVALVLIAACVIPLIIGGFFARDRDGNIDLGSVVLTFILSAVWLGIFGLIFLADSMVPKVIGLILMILVSLLFLFPIREYENDLAGAILMVVLGIGSLLAAIIAFIFRED